VDADNDKFKCNVMYKIGNAQKLNQRCRFKLKWPFNACEVVMAGVYEFRF